MQVQVLFTDLRIYKYIQTELARGHVGYISHELNFNIFFPLSLKYSYVAHIIVSEIYHSGLNPPLAFKFYLNLNLYLLFL